jgi:hypothetical protein
VVVVSLDRAVGFPLPAVITAASIKDLTFALLWGSCMRRWVSALIGYLQAEGADEIGYGVPSLEAEANGDIYFGGGSTHRGPEVRALCHRIYITVRRCC